MKMTMFSKVCESVKTLRCAVADHRHQAKEVQINAKLLMPAVPLPAPELSPIVLGAAMKKKQKGKPNVMLRISKEWVHLALPNIPGENGTLISMTIDQLVSIDTTNSRGALALTFQMAQSDSCFCICLKLKPKVVSSRRTKPTAEKVRNILTTLQQEYMYRSSLQDKLVASNDDIDSTLTEGSDTLSSTCAKHSDSFLDTACTSQQSSKSLTTIPAPSYEECHLNRDTTDILYWQKKSNAVLENSKLRDSDNSSKQLITCYKQAHTMPDCSGEEMEYASNSLHPCENTNREQLSMEYVRDNKAIHSSNCCNRQLSDEHSSRLHVSLLVMNKPQDL